MDGLNAPAGGDHGRPGPAPLGPAPLDPAPLDPAPADPPAAPAAPRRPGRIARSVAFSALGLVIGLGALATLAVGSVHLARQTTSVTDPAQVRADRVDARYYQCLDTQARSLVRPGQEVRLIGDLASVVTLGKAVGGWTVLATGPHVVQLSLRPARTGGCDGVVVAGRFPAAGDGPAVERLGHGARATATMPAV
jgi:hypothetical protein